MTDLDDLFAPPTLKNWFDRQPVEVQDFVRRIAARTAATGEEPSNIKVREKLLSEYGVTVARETLRSTLRRLVERG